MSNRTTIRSASRSVSVAVTVAFYLSLWSLNFLRYWTSLSDDDQWGLWKATMIRLGDLPVRDFVIVGDPLDFSLSLLFQTVWGPTALSEYLLAASVLTLGTFFFAAGARRIGVQGVTLLLVYAGLLLAATRIDVHSTPKHLVLGMAAFTICSVAMTATDSGGRRWLRLAVVTCSVAFLYRHDLLAIVLPPIAVALLVTTISRGFPWREYTILAGGVCLTVAIYVLGIVLVTGSVSGVRDYVRDYVAIGTAKAGQSALRTDSLFNNFLSPDALLRSARDAYPSFISLFRDFLVAVKFAREDAPFTVTLITESDADLLQFFDRAARLCPATNGCVDGIKIILPASANLVASDSGPFDNPYVKDLKGLRRPVFLRLEVPSDRTVDVRWEAPIASAAVRSAEEMFALHRRQIEAADTVRYTVGAASPLFRDPTVLFENELVRGVARMPSRIDIPGLRRDWARLVDNNGLELELAENTPRSALQTTLEQLHALTPTYRVAVRLAGRQADQLTLTPSADTAVRREGARPTEIDKRPVALRDRIEMTRRRIGFVPTSWLFVWLLLLPLAVAAVAVLGWRRYTAARLVVSLAFLLFLSNVALVRWPDLVPVYFSLPLLLCAAAVAMTRPGDVSTGTDRWSDRSLLVLSGVLLLTWFLVAVPTLIGQVDVPNTIKDPTDFSRHFVSDYRAATMRPRSELTARNGGFGFIQHYLNRCTTTSDRVFVVGDKMSIPYVTQRRVFFSTDLHEGVLSSDRAQQRVVEALTSARNVPVFLSEMPGGPVAGLTQDRIRSAARRTFGGWTLVNETTVRPTQQFWLGFSRSYPFDSVDELSGWPCHKAVARLQSQN